MTEKPPTSETIDPPKRRRGRAPDDSATYRVVAQNECVGDGRRMFDFVIEPEGRRKREYAPMHLLAGMLGTAGYDHADEFGLDVEVRAVTVEHVGSPQSDGGHDEDGSDEEWTPSARVVVDVDSTEPAGTLSRWRDRLVADAAGMATAPHVDGLLLVVRNAAGSADGADRSSVAD